jgi:hypothetical protein
MAISLVLYVKRFTHGLQGYVNDTEVAGGTETPSSLPESEIVADLELEGKPSL